VPRHGYSVHGAGNLLALTSLTGLAAASYLQCVFCDAGKQRGWWRLLWGFSELVGSLLPTPADAELAF
jgi:hypothetical protein